MAAAGAGRTHDGRVAIVTGAARGIGLAVAQVEGFWIAQALIAALVIAEISNGVTKIVLYRRGA